MRVGIRWWVGVVQALWLWEKIGEVDAHRERGGARLRTGGGVEGWIGEAWAQDPIGVVLGTKTRQRRRWITNLILESDCHFVLSLVALVKNIKKAVEINEDFAGNSMSAAELLIGQFTGIEALKEEYGSRHTVQQGMELLKATLTKSFELLQKSHGGKLVGVLLSNSKPYPELGAMIDVKFLARESRWLEEEKLPNATIIAEVILVRQRLAWITNIILLDSTLIGVRTFQNFVIHFTELTMYIVVSYSTILTDAWPK